MPKIGCDLVQIDRIQHVEGIAKRLLSPKEYEQFQTLNKRRQKEFLAGRFAAREAIVKALDIPVAYREIEVDPRNVIHYQGYQIQVSISHDGLYAMAVAIACKEESVCE